MDIVYLNGEYLAADKAKISVFDRGFLFGDSVYEVIPYYGGESFQLEAHIQRLNISLAALNIQCDQNFSSITDHLVALNGSGNLSVYLQVSRGAANKRSHSISEQLAPTVFACTNRIVNNYCADADDVQGIKVIVCPDLRWQRCDIKSTNLLPNILVIEQAQKQGAQEALLMRDGKILEGASSNIFIVEGGQLVTPPSSHAILSGTTSQLIQKIAREQGMQLVFQDISYPRLIAADEVWISSSTRGLLPVLTIDELAVKDAQKGPVWKKLYALLANRQEALFTAASDLDVKIK